MRYHSNRNNDRVQGVPVKKKFLASVELNRCHLLAMGPHVQEGLNRCEIGFIIQMAKCAFDSIDDEMGDDGTGQG